MRQVAEVGCAVRLNTTPRFWITAIIRLHKRVPYYVTSGAFRRRRWLISITCANRLYLLPVSRRQRNVPISLS